jgi:hypothetical protein
MKRRSAILIFVAGLLAGIAGTTICFHLLTPPVLTGEFAKHGVTLEKIAKLEIQGDESSRSAGKTITIEDRQTIEFIWEHCIQGAPSYAKWDSSGYRILNFYVSNLPGHPAATLYVNETDLAFLANSKHGYLCDGLEGILMDYLSKDERTTTEKSETIVVAKH